MLITRWNILSNHLKRLLRETFCVLCHCRILEFRANYKLMKCLFFLLWNSSEASWRKWQKALYLLYWFFVVSTCTPCYQWVSMTKNNDVFYQVSFCFIAFEKIDFLLSLKLEMSKTRNVFVLQTRFFWQIKNLFF